MKNPFFVSTGDHTGVCLRICSRKNFSLVFKSRDDLSSCISVFTNKLSGVIFSCEGNYLAQQSSANAITAFAQTLTNNEPNTGYKQLSIFFSYDFDSLGCTPDIRIQSTDSSLFRSKFDIDFVDFFNVNVKSDIHAHLCGALRLYLDRMAAAVFLYWDLNGRPPSRIQPHVYETNVGVVTIFYQKTFNENEEMKIRFNIHSTLNLPQTVPLLRRGQALHPVPDLVKWLGPNDQLLVCPHEGLKPPPGSGKMYVVGGRYTYKHYMQDGKNDKNWGCAYRSLQTLISWLMWQGEIPSTRLPSLDDIQSSLVRCGDKGAGFVGSRQWIGSLEVSFCIQELYNVQCRLVPVARGSQMGTMAAPQLAQHFSTGGGPVMIGGGQLAHTIIGVQMPDDAVTIIDRPATSPRYLILDPHFLGPTGQLRPVLDKGWCGWKEGSFWKPDVPYNLCLLPPMRPERV